MRARLAGAVDTLRPRAHDVAWVAPDNLHVTIKFLGGVDEARVPSIVDALRAVAAAAAPFALRVEGLGAFPTPGRARVLWAGVAGDGGALATLAGAADRALAALGFEPESRPFGGHVTLGRVRAPARNPALATALGTAAGRDFGGLTVERLSLMRSDLSPRGARYTELAGCPLGATAPA